MTGVSVPGQAAQNVGGAWAGFAQGKSHALFHVNVGPTAGTLSFTTSTVNGFSTLNGIQLVAVPEPATLAVLGLGGLLVARRRRK